MTNRFPGDPMEAEAQLRGEPIGRMDVDVEPSYASDAEATVDTAYKPTVGEVAVIQHR